MKRVLAAAAILGSAAVAAVPADAPARAVPDHASAAYALTRTVVPAPTPAEWWFPPWAIQDRVWPVTQGQGVTVAVLDSGVNAARPELAGVVLPGGDTTGRHTDGRTDFAKDGHGTSMAVLIAGQGGGRTGLVGIAPRAKILPVDVLDAATTGDVGGPLAQGIRFAVDHGARVINMSLAGATGYGSGCPAVVMGAIAYAVRHDVVLVAGAGNTGDTDNAVEYPATCPGVLAVGATDEQSRPWVHTQVHDYVSVAAPGVNMPVTGKAESYYYPHSEGTSNAAALVSGAAALVRSANPSMPAREVVRRLIGTALDVDTPGRDDRTGYGIVRITRAMDPADYPLPAGSPNPPYERFDQAENPPTTRPTAAPGGSGSRASRTGSVTDLVVAVAMTAVMALLLIIWFVRRGGRPGGGNEPVSAPGPAASGPPAERTTPGRRPAEPPHSAVSQPPAGFGKGAPPTFEPPEDHTLGG